MQVFCILVVHTLTGAWKFGVNKQRLAEDAFEKK